MSTRQDLALKLLDHPQVVELDFGGAAGGAKTWTVCLWMLLQCRKYPGIRIGLGRKEGNRLRQTSVVTLLNEVHPIMGVTKEEYSYKDQAGFIIYKNGSVIQLLDLNYQPSDPDYDTLGSLLFTHVVIEEAGEIRKKAKDVFGARKDRFMNEKYGITGKLVMTQNPSQNFTRQEFYEPYKKLGAGSHRVWPIGDVELPNGEMKTAYRGFVKSLPTDNPFISKNYIETLKRLPAQERKRLYEGNWDYLDDDDVLFPSLLLDRTMISERSHEEEKSKFIGVDVADKGKDKTIVSLIEDGILIEQKRLNVDTTGEKPISELYSLELIKFAQQKGFTPHQAKSIAIEGNGVGVGMRDFMRSKGWFITEYTATAQTRSGGYYNLSQRMEEGSFQILSQLETVEELRKQLMVHTYEFDEKLQPKVLPKKKIKEELGYSPDEADSAMIANWVANGGYAALDPKKDPSRIVF